jgi:hypothetical protein
VADVAGVAGHEGENLRGQLLAGSVEINVALDDLKRPSRSARKPSHSLHRPRRPSGTIEPP